MRKILIITCITVAASAFYLWWVFHSRSRTNQELIHRLRTPIESRDRSIMEAYGGGLKIVSFYAVPATIRRGETAQLCYSVINAESVDIEPAPEDRVWPSRSRCVVIKPRKDTTYTISAEDAQANAKTAKLTVHVH